MLAEHVRQFIEEQELLPPGARVLVGVSGGADSVVLLHLLQRLGYGVVAAHVHHGLRGAAADRDQAFVRAYCEALGVPLHTTRVDAGAHAEAEGRSVQEAGRVLRYAFFARLARAEAVRHVAVAHHLDDQAETVLLNLFRGSGLEGLAAMPPRRPLAEAPEVVLVRPLLAARRAEVEAYARREGLPWRTDATNASLKYRRGALREVILPLVEEHFGAGVPAAIARTAGIVRGYVQDTYRPRLDEHFAAAARTEAVGGGRLGLEALRALPPVWRRRVILEALARWLPEAPQRAAVAEAVEALLEAQAGRRVELPGGAVWRERRHLRVLPVAASQPAEVEVQLAGPAACATLPGGTLRSELLAERPEKLDTGTARVAFFDADRLAFPLVVRSWRAGDRFQPLGMAHTKKVSDFLTDEKVPAHRRSGVLVACSEGVIVWVVGHRIAEPARVRPATQRVLRLTFEAHDDGPETCPGSECGSGGEARDVS